ncbi:MAG: GNAT family N-acetyltransferase [Bacteroidia bacterium]|nr:GNAT family N-acetyltransferase [Bacteroidia bacterium]
MIIRKAIKDDLETVASIYNQYLGVSTMDLDPLTGDDFSALLHAESEKLFVGCLDDTIIGWSAIKLYSKKQGYQKCCETSTYIFKQFLGKGYGTQFKKFILEECKNLGYTHILARIFSKNKKSISYNLKLGYEIVGVQKDIGYVNGEYLDVTIMQYNFKK